MNYKGLMLTVVLIGCLCLTLSSVFANNADSAAGNVKYKIVQVSAGDSIWSIASRYVTNKEDIRELIAAINKTNQLDSNSKIYTGQTLKIPVTNK
ncbi:MAG: LysM peptidoglycan-binding domain-containing protein [Pelosinus sp.]|nr:LysM peptidoglycan-binding domain-containing protein [Pelosinus sp.]